MQTIADTTPTAPMPTAEVPTVPPAVAGRLPLAVGGATMVAMLAAAALIVATKRAGWWPAFVAAAIVSVLGAAVSIAVLGRSAGKRLDTLVTLVMGTTAARMAVSLIGLLVATMAFKTPAEPTGFMICGFYVAVLAAETTVLKQAAKSAGGTHV